MSGRLVLVATPIGNLGDLSPRAIDALKSADVIACEDTRHSQKLLTHAGIRGPRLVSFHAHNERERSAPLIKRVVDGGTVAVISDAGTPAISDPGNRLVAAAIDAGITVEIVPGPSALVAALAVSGLPTERFCFEGFLPRKGRERNDRLSAIAGEQRTAVLYEAPHRLRQLIGDLLALGQPDRRVVLVRELTKKFEDVWRGTVAAAAEYVDSVEPRGEYVVVVDGAAAPPTPSDADIEQAIRARLDAGDTKKAAVARVVDDLKVPKRTAYEISVRL